MPDRALRECNYMGCHNLTRETYCPEHTRARYNKEADKKRGSAYQRGYDKRWEKIRKIFLSKNPLCVECKSKGIREDATDVDHIIPHRFNSVIFDDKQNLQALCKSCHSRKTGRGL